eukprot:575493-Prorocentrum_minimum.AAC.1
MFRLAHARRLTEFDYRDPRDDNDYNVRRSATLFARQSLRPGRFRFVRETPQADLLGESQILMRRSGIPRAFETSGSHLRLLQQLEAVRPRLRLRPLQLLSQLRRRPPAPSSCPGPPRGPLLRQLPQQLPHQLLRKRASTTSTFRALGGVEGKYRSSVDTREPRNPTKSEEYQRHLQGGLYSTRGAQTSKTRCYQRFEHPGFPVGVERA